MQIIKANDFDSSAPKNWREILDGLKPLNSKDIYFYIVPRSWYWAIYQNLEENEYRYDEGIFYNNMLLVFVEEIEYPTTGMYQRMPMGG